MASEEDMEEAQGWLKKFCASNSDVYDKEENPIRIVAYYVGSPEMQGACMSWAASYLQKLYVAWTQLVMYCAKVQYCFISLLRLNDSTFILW